MSKRVLITGATGFLGFHLIEEALAQGFEVVAAVRKSSNLKHLAHLPIKQVALDYNNPAAITVLLQSEGIDYIIHAAGQTKAKSQAEYDATNAAITAQLGIAAKQHLGLKKFVLISSLAAVGPSNQSAEVLTEKTIPHPVTAYGRSKLLAEEKLKDIKLSAIILRPTAIYGPREKDIFMLVKMVKKGWDPYIGKIAQQLSFVHGRDVAAIAVKSLDLQVAGTYHISDGNSYGRYELADLTQQHLGLKAKRIHLPLGLVKVAAKASDVWHRMLNKASIFNTEKLAELTAANWVCSIEKAKNELGFEPRFKLEKGLADTLKWYQQNNWI